MSPTFALKGYLVIPGRFPTLTLAPVSSQNRVDLPTLDLPMRTISLDIIIIGKGKIEKDAYAKNTAEMIEKRELTKSDRDPKNVALQLLSATSLLDAEVFRDLDSPRYTTVDYYRMACHMIFACQRCGHCCTKGDPIRLRPEDVAAIAKSLKIPLNKALKKYTIQYPEKAGVLNFKHILPCKFYDLSEKGCKIYAIRPWSCRIFPFLGIYGSEDKIKINESCPGSVETMKILKEAIDAVRAEARMSDAGDPARVRSAKMFLRAALDSI
jgi:Fe-S-cluster containining protein